ncbi:MAG: hypothetical protein K9G41_04365 [Flavobacteriales bacterium]|nr:hypothetical protein [Flavobacteriales bacterium]
MKKKNPPRAARNADAAHLAIIGGLCALCAERIEKIQKTNSFVLINGKEQLKFEYAKLLYITVEENYCYFFVRHSKASNEVKKHCMRTTLVSLKDLEEFGLVQVTNKRILNLAHVNRVLKHELFSKNLTEGIEVTKANLKRVAELLPMWSGLQLR